jgi:hypothetical protein
MADLQEELERALKREQKLLEERIKYEEKIFLLQKKILELKSKASKK